MQGLNADHGRAARAGYRRWSGPVGVSHTETVVMMPITSAHWIGQRRPS